MATDALLTDLGADTGADAGIDAGGESFDQPSGEGEGGEPAESQEFNPQDGQQQQSDGRRGPANIRNSIKSASEQFPDQAGTFKELGNAYFREQAYRQTFATPAEATNAKNLIESVGGVDGISTLQQRDQMYTAQDDFLREGNPEVLDDFFEDFPEGAVSLAPHYLEKLAKASPEAFSNAVAPYAVQMMEQAGLGDYLKAIVNETDVARKTALASKLATWFEQQQGGAQQLRATQARPQNAGNDRLSQRETQIQQREEALFKQGTDSKVTSMVEPKLNQVVEQFAKRNKWNDDQKTEFRTRLLTDIAGQMDKDEGYKKQAGLRYSNQGRTHDSVGSYVANEFIRRMNDKDGALATEGRVNKLFGRTGAARPAQPGQPGQRQVQAAPAGVVMVDKLPTNDKIDWNHKDAQVWFLADKARLKTGQIVQVRKRN